MLNGQSIATEDFFTADCGFLKAGLKVLCCRLTLLPLQPPLRALFPWLHPDSAAFFLGVVAKID